MKKINKNLNEVKFKELRLYVLYNVTYDGREQTMSGIQLRNNKEFELGHEIFVKEETDKEIW